MIGFDYIDDNGAGGLTVGIAYSNPGSYTLMYTSDSSKTG